MNLGRNISHILKFESEAADDLLFDYLHNQIGIWIETKEFSIVYNNLFWSSEIFLDNIIYEIDESIYQFLFSLL